MAPEDEIFRDDESSSQSMSKPLLLAVGSSWRLAFNAMIAASARRTPAEALRQSEDWMRSVTAPESHTQPPKKAA